MTASRAIPSIVVVSLALSIVSSPASAASAPPGSGFEPTLPHILPVVQASNNSSSPVNEDPIAANPDFTTNQLMTAGNDPFCTSMVGVYNSSSGGASWSSSCMPLLAGATGCGHPGVAYGNGNLAIVVGQACTSTGAVVAYADSTTNGPPWVNLTTAVSPLPGFTNAGEPSIEVDHNPSSPFFNRIYVSATQNTLPISSSISTISVSFSSSPGVWSTPVPVNATQSFPYIDQFSDLAIGPDGAVYVTWMKCKAVGPANDCGGTYATIFVAKSTDGGSSFGAPVAISNVPLPPDSCTCAYYGSIPNTSEPFTEVPAIDASPVDGSLYVVMDGWNGISLRVRVRKSTDGAATWTNTGPVSPSFPRDEFYPWLSVGSNGYVGLSWLDRRNDPPNVRYQPFASVSINGGATWGPNKLLTAVGVFSDPALDGYGGTFLGDRTGNVWAMAGLALQFHATWPDTNNLSNVAQAFTGGLP